jgi:hypothetical protein
MKETRLEIEFLAIGQNIDSGETKPVSAFVSKCQELPVWQVHQIFIFNGAAANLSLEPVVASGEIGSWRNRS